MLVLGLLVFAILSAGPVAGSDPLEVRPIQISELAPDVHLHVSFKYVEPQGWVGSNGLVVFDGNEAYFIDPPWSPRDTKALTEWVKARGATLKGSLSTHPHEDRTAGIGILNEMGVPTCTSTRTNQILTMSGKPTATVTFSGSSFDWVPDQITVVYPGGGHTQDNVVAWLNKPKILVSGCLVRSLGSKDLGYTGEATMNTWANSIQEVKSAFPTADLVVPGHGAVGDFDLLDHTESLAKTASQQVTP